MKLFGRSLIGRDWCLLRRVRAAGSSEEGGNGCGDGKFDHVHSGCVVLVVKTPGAMVTSRVTGRLAAGPCPARQNGRQCRRTRAGSAGVQGGAAAEGRVAGGRGSGASRGSASQWYGCLDGFFKNLRNSTSSSEQKDTARPSFPSRPVRPMRWTWASGSLG